MDELTSTDEPPMVATATREELAAATQRLRDRTLSKAEAAERLGCSTRTLERRTEGMTETDGRITVGGLQRPAEIRYTHELVAKLAPAPGGDDVER